MCEWLRNNVCDVCIVVWVMSYLFQFQNAKEGNNHNSQKPKRVFWTNCFQLFNTRRR